MNKPSADVLVKVIEALDVFCRMHRMGLTETERTKFELAWLTGIAYEWTPLIGRDFSQLRVVNPEENYGEIIQVYTGNRQSGFVYSEKLTDELNKLIRERTGGRWS